MSLRFAGSMRGTAVGAFVSIGFVGTTGSYAFMGWLLDMTGSWREAYLITVAGWSCGGCDRAVGGAGQTIGRR